MFAFGVGCLSPGGSRLPEGIEGSTDWESLPVQKASDEEEEKMKYGEEYAHLSDVLDALKELKKTISELGNPVEMMRKVRTELSHKKEAMDEEKRAMYSSRENKISKKLSLVCGKLESIGTRFPIHGEHAEKKEMVKFLIRTSSDDMTMDMKYADYMMNVGRCTREVFADQKKVMDRMRKIKMGKSK
jgi:hypothetical protein